MSTAAEDISQDIIKSKLIQTSTEALQAFHTIDLPIHSKYTPEQRYNAVVIWMTYGNTRKVSELTGIPRNTILDWKQSEWWQALSNRFQDENKDLFNAGFTRLIERGIHTMEKAFDNEEVSPMDAAKIMGIAFDKRQILNNQPTSINSNVSSEQLNDLKEQFERLAGKTIEGKRIE